MSKLPQEPAQEISPGEILESAIAQFESLFDRVDDNYMHGDASRTKAGTRFRRLVPGSADVTQPVPYQDHALCAADWLAGVTAQRPPGKVLLWGIQPHFVQLPSGQGFTIVSSFAVQAVLEDDTDEKHVRTPAKPAAPAKVPDSDDPAHDAPAIRVGTAKAADEE